MIQLPNTIKWVITDFDGIMTDNCAYIDSDGGISRRVNFKDIMGLSILKKNGYNIAVISGESNSAIELLAKKFDICEIHQSIRKKIDVLLSIINKYNLTPDEYVYIGDDINDLECLAHAQYKITVPGAVEKVRNVENIQITSSKSGEGAFREIADALVQ